MVAQGGTRPPCDLIGHMWKLKYVEIDSAVHSVILAQHITPT